MYVHAVSFKSYNSILKTAWKEGKLPTVTKGIYGNVLTADNISLEHIIPHSLGGATRLDNLMLAEKTANARRGIKPLMQVITYEQLMDYLKQFIGIKIKRFNGDEYIREILKTIDRTTK